LGIQVDGNLKNLNKLNLASLLGKILASLLGKMDRDLTNWMDLPPTLLGRINAVKMNILPNVLYMLISSNIIP